MRDVGPVVHKFGGAAVGDGSAVRRAAEIVEGGSREAVVVVSAMAGVTDGLVQAAAKAAQGDREAMPRMAAELRERHGRAAREAVKGSRARRRVLDIVREVTEELEELGSGVASLRDLAPRVADQVVSRGEMLSATLFAAALVDRGLRAELVPATEVIMTDGRCGGATPDLGECGRRIRRRIVPLIRKGVVVVVPGFIGTGPEGGVVTLGRGGSDLTATVVGRALGAREINLWKDVPGLLTADPRVVPDARVIPQLHLREAAELAYYGARVLHPRALTPVADRRIPLRIRPVADPAAAGTEVSRRRTLAAHPVKALSAAGEQALVTVTGNGMMGVPGIAARAFSALQNQGISVSLITQASSEHSISFTVPENVAPAARGSLVAAFGEEIARRMIDGVEIRHGMATVAVVGLGMAGTPGIAARVFSALALAEVNVAAIAQGSSELNISIVVDGRDADRAVRRIHDAFQLAKIGGGAAAPPRHADLVLLGFGQIGRTLARLATVGRGTGGPRLRVAAVLDSGGYVFDPAGLGPRRLRELAAAKERGRPMASVRGGRRAIADVAIREIARHALSRPVLVDVTAGETRPTLRLALASGMDVVLANKRPIAGSSAETQALEEAAALAGRRIRYEATVGAGLPIFDTLRKLIASGDRVLRIEGCLSGTIGFVLTEIDRGRPFSAAVKRAMERGFTEPDPRDDLSGADVGRKALILARHLGFRGEPAAVEVESLVPESLATGPVRAFLARLPRVDAAWKARVAAARARDRALRYVAAITRARVRVGIREVPRDGAQGGLAGTDNQVAFTTRRYRENPLVITGPGAGLQVTAAGILNDIQELVRT